METKSIFQKIGIIAKKNIKDDLPVLREVIGFLNKNNKEILVDEYVAPLMNKKTACFTREEIVKKSDLVITLGGDGTLLKTARCLTNRKTPILGINLGTLGFLTEIQPAKLLPALEDIFKGHFHLDRRFLLRVTIYRKKKKLFTSLALNDAVINQGNFARLITLKVEINKRKVARIKADGLIISTPTGSTGHSLSAGGPIVHTIIPAFVISPICPATLAIRPIVVPNNRQITATVETSRRETISGSDIGVTIDGQIVIPLQFGDEIKIRKSKRICHLIRITSSDAYYKKLRDKLNWGGE